MQTLPPGRIDAFDVCVYQPAALTKFVYIHQEQAISGELRSQIWLKSMCSLPFRVSSSSVHQAGQGALASKAQVSYFAPFLRVLMASTTASSDQIIAFVEPGLPVLFPGYKQPFDQATIKWVQASSNYSLVYLTGRSQPLLVSSTLKYMEPILPTFLRVSKSSLVNPRYIGQIVQLSYFHRDIHLTDDTIISIARRRWPLVADQLALYQEGNLQCRNDPS